MKAAAEDFFTGIANKPLNFAEGHLVVHGHIPLPQTFRWNYECNFPFLVRLQTEFIEDAQLTHPGTVIPWVR